jgi:hypothetical protein
MEVIAAILKAPVIERIFKQQGLLARAPPRMTARASMSQAAWSGLTQDRTLVFRAS